MSAYKSPYAIRACRLNPLSTSRAKLDVARQQHLLCLRDAFAAGIPADELAHDLAAFVSAAQQMLEVLS